LKAWLEKNLENIQRDRSF